MLHTMNESSVQLSERKIWVIVKLPKITEQSE